MKKIIIAFDVDGTLIKTGYNDIEILKQAKTSESVNERIVKLLEILSTFKNIKIVVWSGQGKKWAREVTQMLGLEKYIKGYYSKNHIGKDENGHIFEPDIIPDIAIDDIQACDLGKINLICREK